MSRVRGPGVLRGNGNPMAEELLRVAPIRPVGAAPRFRGILARLSPEVPRPVFIQPHNLTGQNHRCANCRARWVYCCILFKLEMLQGTLQLSGFVILPESMSRAAVVAGRVR
jgi:hypothetical protein